MRARGDREAKPFAIVASEYTEPKVVTGVPRLIISVVVCLALSAKTVAPTVRSPYVENYELRSHLHRWSLAKLTSPVTRCLTTSRNGTAPTMICDRRYNGTQLREIYRGLVGYKSAIGSLDLGCAVQRPETGAGYKACVCAVVGLLPNGTDDDAVADGIASDRAERRGNTTGSWMAEFPDVPFHYCGYDGKLTADMLGGYSRLRILSVTSVGVESIQRSAFDDFRRSLQVLNFTGLPLKEEALVTGLLCDMTNLTFVLLTDLKRPMTEFPVRLFLCDESVRPALPSLIGVFAKGNAFGKLPPFMLGAATGSVVSLNLTNNRISLVSNDSFSDMRALQELNLDDNSISVLPVGVFSSLKSLLYLSIQNNKLRTLDTAVLKDLVSLRELYVDGNQLYGVIGYFGVVPKLNTLSLAHNEIAELNATMFNECYSLRVLNLAHNLIDYVHNETFSSLVFLSSLKLNYNMLHDSANLRAAFVRRLEYLQVLDLSHNNLTEVLSRQFQEYAYVSRLTLLNLSQNRIGAIAEDSFLGLTELELIALGSNRLTELKPNTFRHLSKLRMLWIDENQLASIPVDAIPANVVWLSLSFNQIEDFPRVTKKQAALLNVYIGYNKIRRLNRTMFLNFPSITLLNFTHCDIEELGEATFEPMTKLSALDLSGNRLKLNFSINYLGEIYHVSYVNLSRNSIQSADDLLLHHFKYANFLDISHNPLVVFPDQPKRRSFGTSSLPNRGQVGFLYIKNCSLVHVNPNAFELLPNLVHLDLSDNRLRYLDKLNIVQENENVYSVFLNGNPIVCDCHMSWLLQSPYSLFYKLSVCRLEVSDRTVPFDAVSPDQFLCSESTNCLVQPDSCRCFTDSATHRTIVYVQCLDTQLTAMPQNVPASTRFLDLRGNNFHAISFDGFPLRMSTVKLVLSNCSISFVKSGQFSKFYQLELLDLSWNKLNRLTGDVFSGLHKLRVLYLDNNFLHVITPKAFHGVIGLTVLTLHGNRLVALDREMMAAINGLPYLENITLGDNPWRCLCDNATFKHWLLERSDVLKDLSDVKCNGSSFINIADDRFICYEAVLQQDDTAIISVGVLAGTLAVLLVLFVVWYTNRMMLFVLIYHKCGWRWGWKEDENCTYDAFLVYCSETSARSWPVNEFLPQLEPEYKLFIPDRDSLPGRIRSEELLETIRESKRTIFILDHGAVGSDDFTFTLQMAYNYAAESDNHHRTIIIVMDKQIIKDRWQELDTHLQVFLKAKQYISWSDKYFWQKLMYYMPDPSVQRASEQIYHNDVLIMDNLNCDTTRGNPES